jgi:predicted Zn-dependent protease with MMP-like domain
MKSPSIRPVMDLAEFEEKARAYFEEIPPEFRERVQGPVVVAEPKRHKRVRGMLTLGECVHAPSWHSEEPLLSTVFLYYGSFAAVASRDPDFDVEGELRETVRHEVQHHIEDMAGARGLRDYDWAAEEHQKRLSGEKYVPNYWRGGEPVKDHADLRMLDGDLFLEIELSRAEWEDARRDGLVVTVAGEELEIPGAELEHDEEIFEFDGPFEVESALHHEPADGDLTVIVRRRTLVPNRAGARRK